MNKTSAALCAKSDLIRFTTCSIRFKWFFIPLHRKYDWVEQNIKYYTPLPQDVLYLTASFEFCLCGTPVILDLSDRDLTVQAILPIEQSIPRSTYIHPPAVNAAKGAF